MLDAGASQVCKCRWQRAPAQGSVFFYFGDRVSDFAATFLEVGLINVPYPTLLERPDNDDGIPEFLRRAPKAAAS